MTRRFFRMRDTRTDEGDFSERSIVALFALAILFLLVAYVISHIRAERSLNTPLFPEEGGVGIPLQKDLAEPASRSVSHGDIPPTPSATHDSSSSGDISTSDEGLPPPLRLGGPSSPQENGVTGTTSVPIATSSPPYPAFRDVTSIRYENKELGFLMELPDGWTLAYRRGDTVAFANGSYPVATTLSDISATPNAMWISVERSCGGSVATTTVFADVTVGGTTPLRIAEFCVVPFRVTLGLRADAIDRTSRERFLLDVSRTLYPMVNPLPPYAPIR